MLSRRDRKRWEVKSANCNGRTDLVGMIGYQVGGGRICKDGAEILLYFPVSKIRIEVATFNIDEYILITPK